MDSSEALVTLKLLLGIEDDEQDSLLSFLIEDAANMVMGYCRIDFIPSQLESLIPMIAADMYRAKGYGSTAVPQVIKSVTEDKRSVSFESSGTDTDDFLKNYAERLNPFRCRRGRVPSDIQ